MIGTEHGEQPTQSHQHGVVAAVETIQCDVERCAHPGMQCGELRSVVLAEQPRQIDGGAGSQVGRDGRLQPRLDSVERRDQQLERRIRHSPI